MNGQAGVIEGFCGEHLVQFYQDDAELIAAVGPYLFEAAQSDEVAVVIATEAHRQAVERELDAGGMDLVRAQANGRLVFRDAAATLAKIEASGVISHEGFHGVIGSLMQEACSSGRPVRVYGEMVALLWEAGDVAGAIELETLWNDLGREIRFSLLCSYPAASVDGPDLADVRARICEVHSYVVLPPLEFAADYPAELHAPRHARRDVVGMLSEAGRDRSVAAAALIVTELASNAVRHAATPFSVTFRLHGSLARVAVSDQCRLPPESDPQLIAQLPHGLALVEAVATRWGIERTSGGKTIWAEFPA